MDPEDENGEDVEEITDEQKRDQDDWFRYDEDDPDERTAV